MDKYTNVIIGFYLAAFVIAILSGICFGFTGNSHTPPMPFVIELLNITVGLAWLLTDTIVMLFKRTQTWKDIMPHVAGILIHTGFLFYLGYPFFSQFF